VGWETFERLTTIHPQLPQELLHLMGKASGPAAVAAHH
jgi:hypothetical protein